MEKIARVAGQINQHKNQQSGFVPSPNSHAPSHHRTSVESRNSNRAGIDGREDSGYSGSWRNQRGGYPYPPTRGHFTRPVHRHRTLVLNGASQQPQGNAGQPSSGATSDSSTSSWVAKNDRHLQIINSSVYQKEAQARTRAIEQTMRQKQQQRDDLERTKLINHLHRAGTHSTAVPNQYELTVQGIRFAVTKNGSKLVKIPGASSPLLQALAVPNTHPFTGDLNSGPTPKMAIVGGVKFYRSKNGNLYRHGIVKAQRYVARSPSNHPLTRHRQSGSVKKVNVPCRNFSMTGNSNSPDFGTSTDTTSKRLGLVSPKDVDTDIHPQVHAPKAPGADTSTTRPRLPFARIFSSKASALTVTLAISRTISPLNAPLRACTSLRTVAPNLTANSLTQKCLQLPPSAESLVSTAIARRVPAALTAMFSSVPISATLACVIPRDVNSRTGSGRASCAEPTPATPRRWGIFPAMMNRSIAMMSTPMRLTSLLARMTILTWISPSKRTSSSFDRCGPGSSVLVLGFS